MFDAKHDLRHHFGLPLPCANPAPVINMICEYVLPDIANIIAQYIAPCGKNEQIIKEYRGEYSRRSSFIECIARISTPIARIRRCSRRHRHGLIQLACIQCCDGSVYLFEVGRPSRQITDETFEIKFLRFVSDISKGRVYGWKNGTFNGKILVTDGAVLDIRGDTWYTVQGWDD